MTTYYAVPDPTNPSAMTYWRRDRRGRLAPWPPRARYGPTLTPADIPDHLAGQGRREWISDWARAHLWPWHEAIHAAIDTDPDGCAARFAALSALAAAGRLRHPDGWWETPPPLSDGRRLRRWVEPWQPAPTESEDW